MIANSKFRYPLCACSLTLNLPTPPIYLPTHSAAEPTHFVEYTLCCFFFFLSFFIYFVWSPPTALHLPQTLHFPPFILPLECFLFPLISLSPHSAPQSLGLIGICHAVGDKVRPTRGPVIFARCDCPVSQHRHTPSNPPARFVPPALGPHSKQSPGQVLHAQT